MANALKALFQDQADAIREGLGAIGKIKPEDFPAKTREIVALIGSGGGNAGESEDFSATLRITSGSFTAKARAYLLKYSERDFVETKSGSGLYFWECSPAQFVLEAGSTYGVRWKGYGNYTETAYASRSNPADNTVGDFVCVGDAGKSYTPGKSPYIMAYDATNDRNIIVTYQTTGAISCGIYAITAENYGKTIEHGLGQVPDFFIVYKGGYDSAEEWTDDGTLLYAEYGFSSKFKNSISTLGAATFAALSPSTTYGIDEKDASYGASKIYCPDENTVQLNGGDGAKLGKHFFPGATYYWTAVASDMTAGEGGGGSEDMNETAKYNLALAEAVLTRDASDLGDPKVLRLGKFKLSNGNYLGSLNRYSLAGFDTVEKIVIDGVFLVSPYAFRDNKKLKILDVTTFEHMQGLGFKQGSLAGCTALESVIVRDGGGGVNYATFFYSEEAVEDVEPGTGANDTFYVYVPSAYYESIISNVNSNGDSAAVPASRYRRLEDYPEIDYWDKDFTVRCWDGDTLIAEKTVKGGQSLSYKPTKEGYKFFKWDADTSSIVSDMDVHAVWVPEALNDATWTEIDMVAQTGRLSEFYAIGSEKELTITYDNGTTEDTVMVLEAFDNGALTDGTTAKASFLSKYALNETRKISSSSNGSSYGFTTMNDYLSNTFPNYLPTELRAVIKNKKVSGSAADGAITELSYNKSVCWIPSLTEMGITPSSQNFDDKTVAFPRYTSDASRIKTVGAAGAAVYYWTKTYYTSGTSTNPRYTYSGIKDTGALAAGYTGGTALFNLVFGFCI